MKNERELNLPDIIWYIGEKWRLLLLVGLIGLVLAGAYEFYSCETDRKNAVTDPAVTEASEEYRSQQIEVIDLENKIRDQENAIKRAENKKINAEAYIETLQEKIRANEASRELISERIRLAEAYLSDSVLMKIDAEKKPSAVAVYQITGTDETADTLYRDPADEIVSLFGLESNLDNGGKDLAEKYGVTERYLAELFTVTSYPEANAVRVNATGTDEAMAKDILRSVCAMLEKKHAEMEGSVPEHTFRKIREDYEETIDPDLEEYQIKNYSGLDKLNTELADLNVELVNLKQKIADNEATAADSELQISESQIEIAELEPKLEEAQKALAALYETDGSLAESIKSALKLGLVSGIALVILFAGICFLIYIFDGKMHIVNDLAKRYELELLAVLNRPERKKMLLFDRWFYRLRNKGYKTGNEEVLKTAAVTIRQLLKGRKKVAVLSSLKQEAPEKVTASLTSLIPEVEFVAVTGANLSAEAAEALREAEAVIVYEARDISKMAEMEAELHLAELLEKERIGCIVA